MDPAEIPLAPGRPGHGADRDPGRADQRDRFWRWAYHDLPSVPTTAQELWSVRREPAVTVLAENGAILGQRGPLYARPVRLDDLPEHVPQAFLAVEDRRFYEHDGFDERGFARAMWANVRAGGLVQGARP